jgi:hypothetical protein
MVEVVFELNESLLKSLGDWTSLNPVSTTWELLPWSCVVDYFVDVSSYCRGMENAMLYGNSFKEGRMTTGTLIVGRGEVNTSWAKADGSTEWYNLKGFYEERLFERSLFSGSLMPDTPRFRVDLGQGQLMNCAALAATFLKR